MAAGDRVVEGHGSGRVVLRGELDIATASQVREAIDVSRVDEGALVLDFREVEFFDCSALGVILDAAQDGIPIVIEGAPASVRRVLALTGAEQIVELRE